MTAYRVILDTETRPKQAATSLVRLPPLTVEAPDVDTAARLAVAHHIENRPHPPPAGTSFGLIVITPPNRPNGPRRDPANEPDVHHVDILYSPTDDTLH